MKTVRLNGKSGMERREKEKRSEKKEKDEFRVGVGERKK
jgi:hypothetical protein